MYLRIRKVDEGMLNERDLFRKFPGDVPSAIRKLIFDYGKAWNTQLSLESNHR